MNKKLHIFLFLLSILLIFCLLKNIEPFGNQVLLQPGLSFDSRDTIIISLQDDPEIDNSDEMTIQNADTITSGRRIPSAVEERGLPDYAVFEDTAGNQGSSIDTLSPDFYSPEEIQLLNERLEDLQSKLDDVGELFVSEGIKKQCTIPEGIYKSYVIEKIGGDGTPETQPVTQGGKYDYDFFTGATISCVEQSDREDSSVSPSITCDGPSAEFFRFSGCKRVCTLPDTIPDGYKVNDKNMGDGTEYNAGNTFLNNFFSGKVTCDTPNYSSESGEAPSITCDEGKYEFEFQGCKKQCTIGDYDITAYIQNPDVIAPSNFSLESSNDMKYDYDFFETQYPNLIKCVNTEDQNPDITCNDGHVFKFSGCERQCTISQDDMNVYKVLDSNGDEVSLDGGSRTFDYNAFNRETGREYYLTCADDYVSYPQITIIGDNEDELQNIINYRAIDRNDLATDAYNDWVAWRSDRGAVTPALQELSDIIRHEENMGPGGIDIGETWMDLPSMTCDQEGEEVFALSDGARECRKKKCRIPSNGYDYSHPSGESGPYDFDHFDINTNIQGISCAENYEGSDIQINPTGGGVTYDNMCDEDGSFRFTGCEKRQCTIPDGYNYSDGTENRLYDFDHFDDSNIGNVECDTDSDYSAVEGSNVINLPDVDVTYDNMCNEDGFFKFTGCELRQCVIPSLNENMIIINADNNRDLSNTDTVDYGSLLKVECNENYHLEETGGDSDTWEDVTGSKEIICNEENNNLQLSLQSLRCSENECKLPYNKIWNNYRFGGSWYLQDPDILYSISRLYNYLGWIRCAEDPPFSSDSQVVGEAGPISITCPEDGELFKFTGCGDCPADSEMNEESGLCECKKDEEKVSYIGDTTHMFFNGIKYQRDREKACINNKDYFIDTFYNKKYQLWILLLFACVVPFLVNIWAWAGSPIYDDSSDSVLVRFILIIFTLLILILILLLKEDNFDAKTFYAYTTWGSLAFGIFSTICLSVYRIYKVGFDSRVLAFELICALGIMYIYNFYGFNDYLSSSDYQIMTYQRCPKDSTTKYNKDDDEFKCECDDKDKKYEQTEEEKEDNIVGRCVHKKEGDKLSFWILIAISVSLFFGAIKVIVGLNNDDRKEWGWTIILIALIIILICVRLSLESYLNWSW